MDRDLFSKIRCVHISLIIYSPTIPKKKRVLGILNTVKKGFMKINIESSPQEIWIRIRFLAINGSPSLILRREYNATLITESRNHVTLP